uniref:THUMP domain-containing protein 1 n=1 Tax=Crocodylus porosus TaxID=8502 RepID=A0A7M4EF71_CROPO
MRGRTHDLQGKAGRADITASGQEKAEGECHEFFRGGDTLVSGVAEGSRARRGEALHPEGAALLKAGGRDSPKSRVRWQRLRLRRAMGAGLVTQPRGPGVDLLLPPRHANCRALGSRAVLPLRRHRPAPRGGGTWPGWRRHHGGPGQEAAAQGAVRAGPSSEAGPRRGAAAAGAGHAGHPHHVQHERAQVRGGGLQPAGRVRRAALRAREEPEKLVHHILKDMHTTKKKKTRVILRMLPISGTCKAFLEDMKKYTETFFEPWFKAPNKGTFQIVYKARNNSHMSREEVIKELAGIVGSLNPENKVDLNNPEYTIVVEIIKNVCCLSVVKDYVLFRKYNLQEVVKTNKDEGQQNLSSVTEEESSKEIKSAEDSNELKSGDRSQGILLAQTVAWHVQRHKYPEAMGQKRFPELPSPSRYLTYSI